VWPSSRLLADFLENVISLENAISASSGGSLAGKRVLELGGGTGVLGNRAATHCSNALQQTDTHGNTLHRTLAHSASVALHHTATAHCNTLQQHTATH